MEGPVGRDPLCVVTIGVEDEAEVEGEEREVLEVLCKELGTE
jgi:hypothetical protein